MILASLLLLYFQSITITITITGKSGYYYYNYILHITITPSLLATSKAVVSNLYWSPPSEMQARSFSLALIGYSSMYYIQIIFIFI